MKRAAVASLMAAVLFGAASAATGSPFLSGYTVGNTGGSKSVAVGLRKFFNGRPAEVYLLGRVGGFAFYRVQPTATYRCWAFGPASRIGVPLTSVSCPDVVGPYPLAFTVQEFGPKPNYYRRVVAGIAADGAVKMALVAYGGHVIATARVVHNLFAFARPLPKKQGRLVALNADGRRLLPHPGWGHHQTLP
jgi:hypothetical protein